MMVRPNPGADDWDYVSGARWRQLRVHLNDGLITAAGILQALTSAGATGLEALIAAIATTIVGTLLVLGAEYGEAAGDAASQRAIIAAERRRLEMSPDEEFEELVGIYRAKGLTDGLARQVTEELFARDALAAQLDAEYGIVPTGPRTSPWRMSSSYAAAFAVGSVLPMILVAIAPRVVREVATFVIIAVALVISAALGARSDRTNAVAAVLRTLALGLFSMGISLGAGLLLSF